MTPSALNGPHWAFALRLYGQPGVAEACLLLQDRLGVDVNVLLLSAYAAVERGIALDARDLRDMDRLVAPWRGEVVAALRQIRRRLKSGPAPAPGEVTERLRAQIKGAELNAEQIEQAVLSDWLDRRRASPISIAQPSPVDIRDVLRTVAAHFAAASGAAADAADIRDAIEAIVAAASQRPAAGRGDQAGR